MTFLLPPGIKGLSKPLFFDELTSLDTVVNNFDNILLMGEFNSNILSNGLVTSTDLNDLSDTFSLISLIKSVNYTKCINGSSICIMPKNRSNSSKYIGAVTTGFKECHKLILSSLIALFKCLSLKQVIYRDYKYSGQEKFYP